MSSRAVKVAMGEAAVAETPSVIKSQGLGSCVALTLYDPWRKIGGLAHISLPPSTSVTRSDLSFQSADVAIAGLLEILLGRGAGRSRLEAKMAGGASMFAALPGQNEDHGIGRRIVDGIREFLAKKGIPLVGFDVGGSQGRSVEFHLSDGKMLVRTTGKRDKKL